MKYPPYEPGENHRECVPRVAVIAVLNDLRGMREAASQHEGVESNALAIAYDYAAHKLADAIPEQGAGA